MLHYVYIRKENGRKEPRTKGEKKGGGREVERTRKRGKKYRNSWMMIYGALWFIAFVLGTLSWDAKVDGCSVSWICSGGKCSADQTRYEVLFFLSWEQRGIGEERHNIGYNTVRLDQRQNNDHQVVKEPRGGEWKEMGRAETRRFCESSEWECRGIPALGWARKLKESLIVDSGDENKKNKGGETQTKI